MQEFSLFSLKQGLHIMVFLHTKDPLLFSFSETTKHFLHKLERGLLSFSHNVVAKSYLNILSWFDMLSLLTNTMGFFSELNEREKGNLHCLSGNSNSKHYCQKKKHFWQNLFMYGGKSSFQRQAQDEPCFSELFLGDQHMRLGNWGRCRIPGMGWNEDDIPWTAWVSWLIQLILVEAGKAHDVMSAFKYVIFCRIQSREFREMLLIFQCASFYMKYTSCVCKVHFQELVEFWG